MADIRALFWATRIDGATAPFDTAHLKVYYPAAPPGKSNDKLTGITPADPAGAPYPVVLILPGVNVGPESYRWLAEHLVEAGLVVATFTWVGELFPGQQGITPGVDLARLSKDGWGSGPTSSAIGPVLRGLAEVNATAGPLQGLLDLDRIVLGGHSAGGSVALQNANPDWFPGVVGAFAYAAHLGASTVLGWPPATILALPGSLPTLLMDGTCDGVIAGSAARYEVESWDPVARTFHEAFPATGASVWVRFEGANHFAMGFPEDPTVARGFLDGTPTTPPEKTREAIAEVVTLFCLAHGRQDASAQVQLAAWLAQPPAVVASAEVK